MQKPYSNIVRIIKYYLFVFFFTISIFNIHGQVTIGSGNPPARAALLDLKEKEPEDDNVTSKTGGLLLPRVNLEKKAALLPFIANDQNFENNIDKVKDVHTGLVVYNLTIDPIEDLCPGTYEWSGKQWSRLSRPCEFFQLFCSTLSLGQLFKNVGSIFSDEITIKYSSDFRTEITPISYSYGSGLSIVIPPQSILQTNDGILNFSVVGDGTTPQGTYLLSLAELARDLGIEITSSCQISVNITVPQISLFCNAASTTGEMGIYMNKTVEVGCSLDRIPYTIPTGNIGETVDGITASIEEEQILSSYESNIVVTLSGTPTSSGKILVPITIGGVGCNIEVNVAPPFSITCSDVYVTGFFNQDMAETSPTIEIPYTLNSGSFNLSAGIIGSRSGVTARVAAQTLTAPSGYITVNLEGAPIQTLDKVPFTINVQGNSCFIHLSVINPPTICADGKIAKAFVFQQGTKWYVVSPFGSYDVSVGDSKPIALTIECNSEEEALRHPDALQYCGDVTTPRCIRLFDRRGAFVANIYMSQRSANWYGNTGILEADTGCWVSVKAYSGSKIESTNFKTGNLGAIPIESNMGYFGIISGTAKMTDKPLR